MVRTFESNAVVSATASITLDEMFSVHGIDRCRPLKIDCERMGYEMLLGAQVFDKVEHLVREFRAGAPKCKVWGARNDYGRVAIHSLRTTR
jgi:hypothetical protein